MPRLPYPDTHWLHFDITYAFKAGEVWLRFPADHYPQAEQARLMKLLNRLHKERPGLIAAWYPREPHMAVTFGGLSLYLRPERLTELLQLLQADALRRKLPPDELWLLSGHFEAI